MKNDRLHDLYTGVSEKLTDEELSQGWHWCYDFDGLIVGPDTAEEESCNCNDILKEHVRNKS